MLRRARYEQTAVLLGSSSRKVDAVETSNAAMLTSQHALVSLRDSGAKESSPHKGPLFLTSISVNIAVSLAFSLMPISASSMALNAEIRSTWGHFTMVPPSVLCCRRRPRRCGGSGGDGGGGGGGGELLLMEDSVLWRRRTPSQRRCRGAGGGGGGGGGGGDEL